MNILDPLQEWQILWIPFAVMIISQLMKIVLESKQNGFAWSHLNSYGGMPSSHTAMSVSVALIVGLTQGFSSPLFGVAVFVGTVFIRDAIGIRRSLGFHGMILNRLRATLSEEGQQGLPQYFEERLGHTEGQAVAGAIIGILLTFVFYFIAN